MFIKEKNRMWIIMIIIIVFTLGVKGLIKGSKDNKINENEVPYISTYYIEPVNDSRYDVIFEYYVTDYNQKEYLEEDESEKFTIEYWINGEKETINNVKAGDNTINLGKLEKGTYLFDLQATDNEKRKSHRLFNEFIVLEKGVDDLIKKDEIYDPSNKEVLDKFNIYNNNTNAVETTEGLNKLIHYASDNGYKKIVLPKGTYSIDENNTVKMDVSNMILDLNKSLFKTRPNSNESSLMCEISGGATNSHIINGTLEGDLDEHDYSISESSEFGNAVCIKNADYSSFEDLTIRKFVGYGATTMFGEYDFADENGKGARRNAFGIPGAEKRVLGDIKNGEFVENENRISTIEFMPLKAQFNDKQYDYNFEVLGFFSLGAYLGYQGNVTDNWVYEAHFYDENKNYIETIEGYAYRKMRFSNEAKYVKFTFLSNSEEVLTNDKITIFALHNPINSAFKNIKLEDIRCVGVALCGFNNMLVDNMTFKHCGWKMANSAWDAEDGWDMMQDLTIRNSEFIKDTGNGNVYLNCGGHNFIAENNKNFGSFQYERCRSFVYRNNIMNSGSKEVRRDDMTRSGYFRSYGNTYEDDGLVAKVNKDNSTLVYKNEIINGGVYGRTGGENRKIKIIDSVITEGNIGGEDVEFINCTFNDYSGLLNGATYKNCVFNGNTQLNINGLNENIFIDCTFNDNTEIRRTPSAKFTNCTFDELKIMLGNSNGLDKEKFIFNNCTINVSKDSNFIEAINSVADLGITFKACKIKQSGDYDLFNVQRINIDAVFENCQINKTEGYLLDGYYNADYMTEVNIKIKLIDTKVDEGVVMNVWREVGNIKVN